MLTTNLRISRWKIAARLLPLQSCIRHLRHCLYPHNVARQLGGVKWLFLVARYLSLSMAMLTHNVVASFRCSYYLSPMQWQFSALFFLRLELDDCDAIAIHITIDGHGRTLSQYQPRYHISRPPINLPFCSWLLIKFTFDESYRSARTHTCMADVPPQHENSPDDF